MRGLRLYRDRLYRWTEDDFDNIFFSLEPQARTGPICKKIDERQEKRLLRAINPGTRLICVISSDQDPQITLPGASPVLVPPS